MNEKKTSETFFLFEMLWIQTKNTKHFGSLDAKGNENIHSVNIKQIKKIHSTSLPNLAVSLRRTNGLNKFDGSVRLTLTHIFSPPKALLTATH